MEISPELRADLGILRRSLWAGCVVGDYLEAHGLERRARVYRSWSPINYAMSSLCQDAEHHLCNGRRVLMPPSAPWSCRCLCHQAPRTIDNG